MSPCGQPLPHFMPSVIGSGWQAICGKVMSAIDIVVAMSSMFCCFIVMSGSGVVFMVLPLHAAIAITATITAPRALFIIHLIQRVRYSVDVTCPAHGSQRSPPDRGGCWRAGDARDR